MTSHRSFWAHFDALIKADKIRAPKTPSEIVAPLSPTVEGEKPNRKSVEDDLVPEYPAPSDEGGLPKDPADLPFSAGIPPGHPEHREHAVATCVNTEVDEGFLMNNEQHRKYRRMNGLLGSNTIFEYACSETSVLGDMCDSKGIEGARLSRDTNDFADENQVSHLLDQAEQRPGADGWISLSCTNFCPWQHMNIHRNGASFQKKLEKRRKTSRKMFRLAV